jgi:spore coat protein U-like protein
MITLTGSGAGIRVDSTAQQGVQYTILVIGTTTMDFGFVSNLSVKVTLAGSVVHRIEGVDLYNLYINAGSASPTANFAFVYVL